LRELLLELIKVVLLEGYELLLLSIRTPEVLDRIVRQGAIWQEMVPAAVVATIKS
jgi:hypothetical protein